MLELISILSINQVLELTATKIYEGSDDIAIVILQKWLLSHNDQLGAYIAWYELGLLFHKRNNIEAAEIAFRSALIGNPCFPEAAFRLGEVVNAIANSQEDTPIESPFMATLSKIH